MINQTHSGDGLSSHALFAVALPDTRGRHCYLTEGEGDPPRTYIPEHANSYPTSLAAAAAIIEARKLTPLRPRTMIVVPHPANATSEGSPPSRLENKQERNGDSLH